MDLVQYTLLFSRSRGRERVKYGDSLNRIRGGVYRDYEPKEEIVRSTPRPYISGRERKYEKVGSFNYKNPEYIQFRDKDVDRISYYMGKSIGIPDKDLNSINPNKSSNSNKSFKSTPDIKIPQSNPTNYKVDTTKLKVGLGLTGGALIATGAYMRYKKYKRNKAKKSK